MKLRYLATLLIGFAVLLTACEDEDYEIATGTVVTEITTGSATTTAVSAVLTGTVKDLSSLSSASYTAGAYYGTDPDPINSGSRQTGSVDEDGNITVTVTGLSTGETYYYAIYVTLQGYLTYYGEVKSFVATDVNVTTVDASNVSACKATFGCTVTGTDGVEIETGIKLSATSDATSGRVYEVGEVSGLLPHTMYYYVAYALVDGTYIYGDTKSFTTSSQKMEYVDLGLSVQWAKWNIGAESESEVGALVGYGEPTGLVTGTSLANYASYDIYGTEDDIVVGLGLDSDDASTTPTDAQIAELLSKTTQTWTTVDGVEGMRFTAVNGNSIFFPATGYRDGTEVVEDGCGYYWSGNVYSIDGDYANTLKFDGSEAAQGFSTRYLGLAVRSVYASGYSIEYDPDKIKFGDLEGNGNLRIEIYNEYGSTVNDPPINTSDIYFTDNMVVTFTLSGITDNLKEGAPEEYIAGLEYADDDWWPGYWAALETLTKYDAKVTGDGTYVVWMDMHTPDSEGATEANGAVVFCIDIGGLMSNIADASKVSAKLVSIDLDHNLEQAVNKNLVEFNNKDGNGTDGRIEIYNEYGNSGNTAYGYYNDQLFFNGMMIVEFTLSGIDGNLNSGVTPNYQTQLSFADADWWPAFWGEDNYGDAYVTGDGTYETYAYLGGDCEGAVCWTVEIYGLWQDLADPYAVTATVNKVTTPGKVHD